MSETVVVHSTTHDGTVERDGRGKHPTNVSNRFKSLNGDGIVLFCAECKEPFYVHPSQTYKKNLYCSLFCKCARAQRENTVICIQCSKSFEATKTRRRIKNVKFCSWDCRNAYHASRRIKRVDRRLIRQVDVQMSTESQIAVAWALASEGTIGVRIARAGGKNPSFIPFLTCTNTNPVFIERFCDAIRCGRVYFVDRIKYGDGPQNKDVYIWQLTRTLEVKQVILQIMDHLPIKLEQAKLVLELCDMKINRAIDKTRYYGNQHKSSNRNYQRELEIFQTVKSLNKRGRPGFVP